MDSNDDGSPPQKRINTPEDFEKWLKSKAYKNLVEFILELNDAVKSKPLSIPCNVSPVSLHLEVRSKNDNGSSHLFCLDYRKCRRDFE